MRRSFKFLLRPTARQAGALAACLEDHRQLYNAALEHRRIAYRAAGVTVRHGDQSAVLKEIRRAGPGGQGGEHLTSPRLLRSAADRLAAAQRDLARCERGSNRRRKTVRRVAALHAKVRLQRLDTDHKAALRLVGDHDVIVHEALRIANMTHSASGTIDEPGRCVAAGSGLNRSILDAGWGVFLAVLAHRAESAGRELIAVNPANTSRTCAACGRCATRNRVTQAEFRCLGCGHTAHADVNAAINILRAGLALRDAAEAAWREAAPIEGRRSHSKESSHALAIPFAAMSALAAMFRLRPVVAVLSGALSATAVLSVATCVPAAAEPVRGRVSAAERVLKDEAVLTTAKGGVTRVKETILYRFAGGKGFDRTFPTRSHESLTEDRVYKIENLRASSPDGGPTKVTSSSEGTRTTVKVSGGPELTGDRTVVLEYDVRGAITQMGAAEELRWPVIGGWKVPVDEARATVDGGTAIRSVNCFTGPIGSTIGCTQYYTNHTHTQGVYVQQGMLPGEYLTVVAGLPAGTTGGRALHERRHTIATAFSVNAVTGGALVGLLALLGGGLAALYLLRGRDARVVVRKAAEGDQVPVAGAEFEPPDGVRPGQIGTLIDEQADVIDVTATIVDLAVRGYLLIEEEDRARSGRLDWTLRRLGRPVVDLLPYERILLDALLTAPDGSGRDAVKLSELGGTFATKLAQVRSAMYDDVVKQGWFARRPDTVRSRWTVAGILITVLGVVGTVALALTTEWALAGLAVIIAGAALAYGGQYMPAKTARGATVLAHTIGFRAFLERGAIPDGDAVASRQRIALFSRLLPYAVVFDAVPKWAETVKDAGERAEGADNLYWYEGPAEWDLSSFAESMRTFTLATSGSISQSRGL